MRYPIFSVLIICSSITVKAQNIAGPAERTFTDSICSCITRSDIRQVSSKEQAIKIFTTCIAKYPSLMLKTAEERKVSLNDVSAMHDIGLEIGKDLMRANCDGFMQLSMKMASNAPEDHISYGKLVRVDNKGLNYFVITDGNGREESFLWLHQFTGSSAFTNGLGTSTGKRVTIKWAETEIYMPALKGYFNVREVISLDVK